MRLPLTAGWVIVRELLTVVVFITQEVECDVTVGVLVMLKVMVGVIYVIDKLPILQNIANKNLQ